MLLSEHLQHFLFFIEAERLCHGVRQGLAKAVVLPPRQQLVEHTLELALTRTLTSHLQEGVVVSGGWFVVGGNLEGFHS